jgi:hypothetical protein
MVKILHNFFYFVSELLEKDCRTSLHLVELEDQNLNFLISEAKQMAQAARASLCQMKTTTNTATSNSTETTTTNQLSTLSTITDNTVIQLNTCEPIEISDDDSSPITSANSFLTNVSNSRTDNVINRTLEPG